MNSLWTDTVGILLPAMTERVSDWVVLKNHERLPAVTGDIDLCLDRSRWNDFTRELTNALEELGTFSVLCCDHFPDLRLLFVVDRTSGVERDSALELDLADGIWWKGHRLMPAAEVARRALVDPRGFRYAPPGIEAAFHLTVESLSRTGALRTTARHYPRIKTLAAPDEDTFVHSMERMHGSAGRRAAHRLMRGTWSGLDGALLVARRVARGPGGFGRRGMSWLRRRRMWHWRGLPRAMPHGSQEWLARVAPGHEVVEVPAAPTGAAR